MQDIETAGGWKIWAKAETLVGAVIVDADDYFHP
jgi:hypothetical protein